MYQFQFTTRFKKDLKKVKSKKADYNLTVDVLKILQQHGVSGVSLDLRPHKLSGKYKNNWECHIKPDLLIIWIQIEKPGIIKLVRIGTHSDIF